ncbi:hypothetical protein [Streptomyces tendae]|uniref:hypothetical protein n=1 Tax=Streptomyces tendae TaxID=1932 RepID=UPI0037AB6404
MTAFTRGFRLHLANGQVLDGATFPSGRTIVVDDPEYGLATVTTSLEVLLQGYHRARVEWDDEALLDGQPRPTADSITSDQLDALLLKAARADSSRVTALREAASVADGGRKNDCGCGGCDTCAQHRIGRELRRRADEQGGGQP